MTNEVSVSVTLKDIIRILCPDCRKRLEELLLLTAAREAFGEQVRQALDDPHG